MQLVCAGSAGNAYMSGGKRSPCRGWTLPMHGLAEVFAEVFRGSVLQKRFTEFGQKCFWSQGCKVIEFSRVVGAGLAKLRIVRQTFEAHRMGNRVQPRRLFVYWRIKKDKLRRNGDFVAAIFVRGFVASQISGWGVRQ